MKQNYPEKFKKKTVRLQEEAGRTYPSLIEEYGVSKASIKNWCESTAENAVKKPKQHQESRMK